MNWIQAITLVVAVVGVVCGLFGTVLSIINFVRQLDKDKVKLKVIPKLACVGPNRKGQMFAINRTTDEPFPPSVIEQICVEVINLSSFPVTVSQIWIGPARKDGFRHVLCPCDDFGDQLPKRLDSRQSMTAYASKAVTLDPDIVADGGIVFAETECGAVAFGTSPAFQQYVRALKAKGGRR